MTFLILGREAGLSFAEVYNYAVGIKAKIAGSNKGAVVLDKAVGGDLAALLGGVPKAGEILAVFDDEPTAEKLAELLGAHILPEKKFHFGLSIYGGAPTTPKNHPFPSLVKEGKRESGRGDRMKLGLSVKKILRGRGHSVRLVESRSGNLSSVDVVKNKLLANGAELCLIVAEGKFFVGRTISVQPFAEYSDRDYGRPDRDPRRGMLPPKLARTMINLAAVREGQTILDPFCGVGTVLQEALLMGFSALGSDNDQKAVHASQENLDWLVKENPGLPEFKLQKADARELGGGAVWADAIVSELYLGPPVKGGESSAAVKSLTQELSRLYQDSLASLAKTVEKGSRAVLVWPYYKRYDLFVPALHSLKDWNLVRPYPEAYEKTYPLSKRGTIIYGRAGQEVYREIIILERKTSG